MYRPERRSFEDNGVLANGNDKPACRARTPLSGDAR
jgi:hypothetical protein